MHDMIAAGAAWFDAMRREHLSVMVDYRRVNQPEGFGVSVPATIGMSRWDSLDNVGQITRYETRDYMISVDDLEAAPSRGDQVRETDYTGLTRVYEVTAVGGNNHWQWADRGQRIRRIHTTLVG